jgi:hypothetical protein
VWELVEALDAAPHRASAAARLRQPFAVPPPSGRGGSGAAGPGPGSRASGARSGVARGGGGGGGGGGVVLVGHSAGAAVAVEAALRCGAREGEGQEKEGEGAGGGGGAGGGRRRSEGAKERGRCGGVGYGWEESTSGVEPSSSGRCRGGEAVWERPPASRPHVCLPALALSLPCSQPTRARVRPRPHRARHRHRRQVRAAARTGHNPTKACSDLWSVMRAPARPPPPHGSRPCCPTTLALCSNGSPPLASTLVSRTGASWRARTPARCCASPPRARCWPRTVRG